LSLIRSMFADAKQRTFAIAVWITSFSVGAALGPLIGGALLEQFWWGSVFLIAVPVMIMILAVGPVLLPEFRDPQVGRMDLPSAGLSLATVLLVILGLKRIAQEGLQAMAILAIVAGLVIGFVFVRRQQSVSHPLIDLRVFKDRVFSTGVTINTLEFFVGFGIILFISQYLQLVLGLSPLKAGLWMVPWACGFVIGSMLTPVFLRHARPAFVMAAGLVFAAIGFGVLTQVETDSGLAILVTGSVVFSVGLAPMTTLATDLMVGNAPAERAGAVAAIAETSSEFGGALGIAVMGSVGTAIYRYQMAEAPLTGLSPSATDAARSTLGGAVSIAAGLPQLRGAELLNAAREGFVSAFQVTATLSAIIVIATAVMAVACLRHLRS